MKNLLFYNNVDSLLTVISKISKNKRVQNKEKSYCFIEFPSTKDDLFNNTYSKAYVYNINFEKIIKTVYDGMYD